MAPVHGFMLVALVSAMALAAPATNNATEVAANDTSAGNQSSNADEGLGLVHTAVQRGCATRYTMTCLKLDALSVLSRMAVPASYDLLPGVTIHRQQQVSAGNGLELPGDLVRSLASDNPHQVDRRLDDFLMARFGNFLDSHTVQVHLLDLQPVASLRKAMGTQGDGDATARRKNGVWQQLMGAGMMMGGSTLTMGLSALAAMAGKALMLSMLSLVLSALSGMNSGGGGHSQKQTTYEIISKPIYTHGHSHSAELHHEPSGPAGYGLYGRAKDVAESALSAGTGASGVGSSAIGAQPGSTYITQFPRSLQESAAQVLSHSKQKSDEDKASSPPSAGAGAVGAANYDSLLIRNLQYVKGPDGRAKYAVATDLVPAETDYANAGDEVAASAGSTQRKYASHNGHDDPAARSFQLTADEEDEEDGGVAGVAGLAGVYEAGSGVLAGPRSMHTFARLPQLLVARPLHGAYPDASRTPPPPALTSSSFREPLPSDIISLSSPGSSWEAITAAPPPATSTGRVNPAFVVAKPVAPSSTRVGEDFPSPVAQAPRTVAYRAYS